MPFPPWLFGPLPGIIRKPDPRNVCTNSARDTGVSRCIAVCDVCALGDNACREMNPEGLRHNFFTRKLRHRDQKNLKDNEF